MAEGPRLEGDGIAMGRVRGQFPSSAGSPHNRGERDRFVAPTEIRPEAYATRADRYVEVLGTQSALMKVGQMLSVIPSGSSVPPRTELHFKRPWAVFSNARRWQLNSRPNHPFRLGQGPDGPSPNSPGAIAAASNRTGARCPSP